MTNPNSAYRPSALVEFRAKNARSYRDEVSLSLEATALSEPQVLREVPWREGGKPLPILPAAGVFGPNASGKSNLLETMQDMQRHVRFSFRHVDPGGGISRQPFRLDKEYEVEPSTYEIDFVLHGVLHQYGFVLDSERVIKEWAYRYPKGRAALLFDRDREAVRLGPPVRSRGKAILNILAPNALFLSTAASAGHPIFVALYRWFETNLMLADADNRRSRIAFTAEMLEEDHYKKAVVNMLRAADLGITGARIVRPDLEEQERLRRAIRIMRRGEDETEEVELRLDPFLGVKLIHRTPDGGVELEDTYESRGTLRWFSLIGPVLKVLESGSVLLVDELDGSLHPELSQEFLRFFQDPEINIRGAQLVFNSHDMQLLANTSTNRPLGRDQIWFTQKLYDGATHLLSLTNYDPRKQESIAKRYLEGYYGAKPFISGGDSEEGIELVVS